MSIIRLQSEQNKLDRQHYEFDPEAGSLGQGGMGVVYKGRFFGNGRVEDVAIKALYKDLPKEAVERALKEASIRIAHDNVILMLGSVSVKDAGGSLRHHVISEYLDGETLDKQLQAGGRKSIPEALHIIKCVLSGLSALHHKNLVHRDIDPSNIMVCKNRNIKIIDLGVVKELETTGQRKTVFGQFIGKIDYASPEQLAGLQDLVRQTSDIYSTGVVLYELITGRLPFTGTTYDITTGHKEKNIPLEAIPDKNLRYVIRKAMAKNVRDRYQSTYEFIVDIEKIQHGQSPIQNNSAINKRILMTGVAAIVTVFLILFFLNFDFKGLGAAGKQDASHTSEGITHQPPHASDAELLFEKGKKFAYGFGVTMSPDSAIRLYRAAAAQNYPPAHYELFTTIYKETFDKDPKWISPEAMRHLKAAADLGYTKAQDKLGRLLINIGENSQMKINGYQYIKMAAEKNNPYALAQMGLLHMETNSRNILQLQQTLGIQGDNAKAESYLKSAIAHDAENYHAGYVWGLYYATLNNKNEENKHYRESLTRYSKLKKSPYRADEWMYSNIKSIEDRIGYKNAK